jgi:phosphoglycerol transferase MdoB-like AlkP superfamily enzyme
MALLNQVVLPLLPFTAVAMLVALLFIIFLLLFRFVFRGLNSREVRRALVFIVVSFYLGSIASVIAGVVEDNSGFLKIIDGLNLAFISVVSFYFGSRTIEKYLETKYSKSAESHPRKEAEEQELL